MTCGVDIREREEAISVEDKICIPLSETELRGQTNSLVKAFIKFARQAGLDPRNINIERSYLPLILQRVEKRRQYFHYFHDDMEINEVKQAALVAYWVLKFRPFSYRSDGQGGLKAELEASDDYKALNERFAYFYILSACLEGARTLDRPYRMPSNGLAYEVAYAFKYWDLSKEAVILIAEIIGEAFFGIPMQITNET